jgi:dihydrofolate reductase
MNVYVITRITPHWRSSREDEVEQIGVVSSKELAEEYISKNMVDECFFSYSYEEFTIDSLLL